VEAADDERSLRRARRFIWAFRLIFYPGAAIIAILLLAGRSGADTEHLKVLQGRTSQGETFTLWIDDDHRPRQFYTSIRATCPDGGRYVFDWHRVDADRIAFDEHTGTIDAAWMGRGTWSNGVPRDAYARLQGHLLDDDTVRGTLRLLDHRRGYDCDSGPVTLAAG
jgi:hypothetical protein